MEHYYRSSCNILVWSAAAAHRLPDKARELCITAQEKGFGVVIAAGAMAAALPGVVSAYTLLSVL